MFAVGGLLIRSCHSVTLQAAPHLLLILLVFFLKLLLQVLQLCLALKHLGRESGEGAMAGKWEVVGTLRTNHLSLANKDAVHCGIRTSNMKLRPGTLS